MLLFYILGGIPLFLLLAHSIASAFVGSDNSWTPSSSAIVALVLSIATVAVYVLQLRYFALLISDLAGYLGVMRAFVLLHFQAFSTLLLVLIARALYVCNEFDEGRYFRKKHVVDVIKQGKAGAYIDVVLRAAILLALYWSLLRLATDISSPTAHGALARFLELCYSYQRNFGQDINSCIQQELPYLEITSEGTGGAHELVRDYKRALSALWVAYPLMIIWSLFAYIAVSKHESFEAPATTEFWLRRIRLHSAVPLLGLLGLFSAHYWFSLLLGNSDPIIFSIPNPTDRPAALAAELFFVSCFGLLLSMLAFLIIWLRMPDELKDFFDLFRKGESSGS